MGTPTEQEINSIPRDKFRKMVKQIPKRVGKPFKNLFPNASNEGKKLHLKLQIKSFFLKSPRFIIKIANIRF